MEAKEKLLKFLNKNDFVSLHEATEMGVGKMALSRMVAEGKLYRPYKRIYTSHLDWLTDPLRKYAPVCTLYPDAIVCGVSALTFYDLTDEEERKIWLAFPQEHRVVNQEYRIVYPQGPSYRLGVVEHLTKKRKVRIYDREKSVVDAFKFLPIDVAYKVLRGYLRLKDKDLDKLSRYAKQMRKPLDRVITVLLSDQ
ncbi:MAG: hypothetical protein U1F66_00810 [bacterium]